MGGLGRQTAEGGRAQHRLGWHAGQIGALAPHEMGLHDCDRQRHLLFPAQFGEHLAELLCGRAPTEYGEVERPRKWC